MGREKGKERRVGQIKRKKRGDKRKKLEGKKVERQ